MHQYGKVQSRTEEHKDVQKSLEKHLDEIATLLASGDIWHRKMANACRMQHIRGWGRWHDKMSKCYHKWLLKLSKISTDNIEHTPSVHHGALQKVEDLTLKSASEFKNHHSEWNQMAGEVAKLVAETMMEAHEVNIQLYKCLMELLEEIQEEMKHVKRVVNNLNVTGWDSSYVMQASEKIHEHYEKDEEKHMPKDKQRMIKEGRYKADLGLMHKGKHDINIG